MGKQKKQTHLDVLQRIVAAAENENRELTDAERGEFDTAEKAAKSLQGDIERALTTEGAALAERPASPAVVITDKGVKVPILKTGDRLAARFDDRAEFRDLLAEGGGAGGFGAAIKGIVTGDWGGRSVLQRALSEGSLGGGGYTVPAPLAARWLDMLRSRSVVIESGIAGVIPMEAETLRIAALASDPVVTSRKENTAINASDPTFSPVDLKAKSYGVLVTSSAELLADSPNAEIMIEAALLGAMRQAFDAACLNGDGSVAGNLANVLGILQWPGIGDIPYATGWDAIVDAMAEIWGDNLEPENLIMGPTAAATFAKLKTGLSGDLTTLVPPPEVAALERYRTTGMPADTALVAAEGCALVGMRQEITIEATREGGTAFGNNQVLLRALMRFDIQPLFGGKGFAKVATVDTP